MLCNKCGLFERAYSKPLLEKFPHERGPLASSTLRAVRRVFLALSVDSSFLT
ncbi:hypothetical protein B0H16DRAFT_1623425 [Mycena metata]|uniref:Uncharacterized protein n=1 Tax=Mycena metata TaxID=1033252 RepID=A0AAD7H5I4_9AGAR|nr:hypothetical protein B0H16DRAFT_1623425 [Mycena metata]